MKVREVPHEDMMNNPQAVFGSSEEMAVVFHWRLEEERAESLERLKLSQSPMMCKKRGRDCEVMLCCSNYHY
jgi:hypothetical protein